MANINFEKCPFYPLQFDILDLESKKKIAQMEGAPWGAPSAFGEFLAESGQLRAEAPRP
jgi:hypothetical protein